MRLHRRRERRPGLRPNQCLPATPTCDEPVFYGVVVRDSDGALFSIRCWIAGGGPAQCEMPGGVLALGDPVCE